MTNRIALPKALYPKEVRSIVVKPKMVIQELKLTDLGLVKDLAVGGKRMSVLLGLQPNGFARRFIEQTAQKAWGNGNVVDRSTIIWRDVNRKGVVRHSGLYDFQLIEALDKIGLKVRLPNKDESKIITNNFQSFLLDRGIEIFLTSSSMEPPSVNDCSSYQVYHGVRQKKSGTIDEFSNKILNKESLVLVANK